ncbi:MAG: FAD-dependent oxidoreductase [Chromatocurvus sp.]
MAVLQAGNREFELTIPVLVVGAGACGLCAGLAARDGGAEVMLIERDPSPIGTTGMSTGLIPAAGTPEQRERGIEDSPSLFAADIMKKAQQGADGEIVQHLAAESAETVMWLREHHGVELSLVDGFVYPGHSVMRMYGTPHRTGTELMAALQNAAVRAGVDILTQARVRDLLVGDDGDVVGVMIERPDGATESIGCDALILACCGFAGNPELVSKFIPEIADGVFHGHPGNKGDAVVWGEALGASLADMDAYQGHGGLAVGHAIPILWPLIMEGGIQVNREGRRFSDESAGYSEQATRVLAQTDGVAFSLYDGRLHELMLQFDDYRDALEAGAVVRRDSPEALAEAIRVPTAALKRTLEEERACKAGLRDCAFGRDFSGKAPLQPPFYAARVTGALFHTQGGLEVDRAARVIRQDGTHFARLFAGGGAARGVSGAGAAGYMAGNGLLTATTFGKLAGRSASAVVMDTVSAAD